MVFSGFSRADVEVLNSSPSEPIKISLIEKLYESFHFNKLNNDERLIAEEILRFLAADISTKIRQSIANKFCEDIKLPYDVAVKLANDLEDIVALPIIENSTILKEKDLMAIIEAGNIQRQKAVATRPDLNSRLATHIITHTSTDVITILVSNKRANLSPDDAELIISTHCASQPLMKALIEGKRITTQQAHNLLTTVSTDLRTMLITEYEIPGNVVNNLIHDSKESLIINMIVSNMERRNPETLAQMINKLHAENELTFSVLVKALSFGNIAFFEMGIAKLADLPLDDVRARLWNHGDNTGFDKVYTRAHLPEAMAPAVYKLMLVTAEEALVDNPDTAAIHYRILNRLARASNNENVNNLDYLVTIVAYNLKKSNLL